MSTSDRSPVEDYQGTRWKIVRAMMEVVVERGYPNTSVKLVASRGRVSTRTFYRSFASLDDCMTAALEMGYECSLTLITQAFTKHERWPDGVRAALTSLLVFFDSEPLLTRMWFVDTLTVGRWALEHHERSVAALKQAIVEHYAPLPTPGPDAHLTTGVMASVLGLIQSHVVAGKAEPLIGLLGPLIELIETPFLDPELVRMDVRRGENDVRELLAESYPPPRSHMSGEKLLLPALLSAPNAHRARRCMLFVACNPGASNRQVASGIEVTHHGQVSTLLGRLRNLELLEKTDGAPGHPNAWWLTAEGERAVSMLTPSPLK